MSTLSIDLVLVMYRIHKHEAIHQGLNVEETHLWKAVVRRLKNMISVVVSNVSAATAQPKPAEPIHYELCYH